MAKYNKNRYGSIILEDKKGSSFTITKKEQEEIKTLVKRANSKRTYNSNIMFNEVKNNANMKGVSKEAYSNLLNKKGFITEKYSTNLKQLKSKADVKDFIKELKTVTKKGYYEKDKAINDIRKTMIKRAKENYNDASKPLVNMLKGLTNNQLKSVYIHNDELVRAVYGSPPISEDQVEELVNKSMSDINYTLKK